MVKSAAGYGEGGADELGLTGKMARAAAESKSRLKPAGRDTVKHATVMPNGRTDGCAVRKTKLRRKLAEQPATLVVGAVIGQDSDSEPVSLDVTAADVLRLVDEFAGQRVWVEEQHYVFYIIHLDAELTAETEPEDSKSVLVRPDSLF